MHKQILADKGIVGGNYVERSREKGGHGYLHIYEAGMVHQKQTGLLFAKLFHSHLFQLESGFEHIGKGHALEKYSEKHIGANGLFTLVYLFGNDLGIRLIDYFNFHTVLPGLMY